MRWGKLYFFIALTAGMAVRLYGYEFVYTPPFIDSNLLNLNSQPESFGNTWKSLSREERARRKEKIVFKVVDRVCEYLYPCDLDYLPDALEEVLEMVKEEREFERYLERKYSVRIKFEIPRQGMIIYTHRF